MKQRVVLSIFFIIVFATSFGQSRQTINSLVQYVEQADSLANKGQRTFNLVKIGRSNDGLKETWHYTTRNGKVIVFQVRYTIDSIEFTEVYYVNSDRLICSEEYETVYLPEDDELKFGGICYFDNNDVIQNITLGRRSRPTPRLDEKHLTLDRFRNRYAELRENLVARNP